MATRNEIAKLYVATFNRAADADGLAYWVSDGTSATTGLTDLNDIAAAMIGSAEYAALYSGLSREDTVIAMYANLFNRTVDGTDAGVIYWSTGAGSTIALDTMILALINGADAADSAVLDNKTTVGLAFADAGLNDVTQAQNVMTGVTASSVSVTNALTAINAITVAGSGTSQLLTTSQDNLTGNAGNDLFQGYIFDNQNTAQSGDMIDGKDGVDRLEMDIGNSQNVAIRVHTNNVEQIAINAQSNDTVTGQNNMGSRAQVDAERMVGANWYESNNSRADVVVEDVRILSTANYNDASNQITKDVTIAMVSTDPGDVDLDVYFDDHSLIKQAANTSNSITMTVGNQVEASSFDAAKPLKDIPYTNVSLM